MQNLGKKAAAIGFLLFLVLWIWGIFQTWNVPTRHLSLVCGSMYSDLSSSRGPVANNLKQIGMAEKPLLLALDQVEIDRVMVYEKNAQLAAHTKEFAEDEALIHAALTALKARILHEKKSGIGPDRLLVLAVGVAPEKFDTLLEKLRAIGNLESITVNQHDRTSEFRRLHEKRQELKKHLEAILKLRDRKNPTLDDELKLEQKISDLEKELLSLGGKLGDLVGRESYYHIYLTLQEHQPESRLDRQFALPMRLLLAVGWALPWWFTVMGLLAAAWGTYLSFSTLWPKRV